jgi:hypothetical protein
MTAETNALAQAAQLDERLGRSESKSWLDALAEAVGFARALINREV